MKKFSELSEKLKKDKDDPCWKGYVQVGMKKKNGKEVPNCVPKESTDEAMSLADIRRKKEREERRKRDHDGETQHQRMMRKVYGNMMGGLKKEEVELDEISRKLARKAAASSAAKNFEYGSSAYGPDADKEMDRLDSHMDKKYPYSYYDQKI